MWLREEMLGGQDLSEKDKDTGWFDFLAARNLDRFGTPDHAAEIIPGSTV